VVTQYLDNPRAVPAEELGKIVREALKEWGEAEVGGPPAVVVSPTPQEAWQDACRHAQPGELVCITGSLFLIAELRPLVLQNVPKAT